MGPSAFRAAARCGLRPAASAVFGWLLTFFSLGLVGLLSKSVRRNFGGLTSLFARGPFRFSAGDAGGGGGAGAKICCCSEISVALLFGVLGLKPN